MTKAERDAEICKRYKGDDKTPGATLEQLAERYALSRERIRQIVLAGGLSKHDRSQANNSNDTFLGVYIPSRVKRELKNEAEKRGVSVSSLSIKAIIAMLVDIGYSKEQLSEKAVDRLVNE